MKTTIQSENLSSIMIYTGTSYMDAASYLANRQYGSYISELGYLSRTNDLKSYWTNYSDLLYEETEYKFDKIKDIYDEGQAYLVSHYDNNGVVTISQMTGNNKTVSRYHAEYSYQHSLDNDFSNIVDYTAQDLNDFLFSLNYQKYNKEVMYGSEYELNSVRIGAKTFNWHTASDIAYTNVIVESTDISYFFAYVIDDDNNVTYFHSLEDYISGSITGQSYTYAYDYTDNVYTYDHYYYPADGFYTYIQKEYLPIIGTLKDEIEAQSYTFETKYGHNEDLYTYYMYDCSVDIPMTLTTRSLGVKKSTFEMRYSSDYDRWFEYVIPMTLKACTTSFDVTAYETGVFGIRVNENEQITESDTTIEADETATIAFINGEQNAYTSMLSPYNMKKLDMSNVAHNIDGVLNLTYNPWTTNKGNHLVELTIGNETVNENITKIMGVNDLVNLEYLDISNINHLATTPAISRLTKLNTFKAKGSNIKAFKPAVNATLKDIELPAEIENIRLQDVTFADNCIFDYTIDNKLNSLVLDNVKGLDTYKFVTDWNTLLKTGGKLIPKSLIYLELNKIKWEKVPVTIMEDIKKFDLNIKEAEISVVGTSIYGMLSREEYISMTKLYGVNAFYSLSDTEKVFKDLSLTKYIPGLPEYEYTFTMSSTVDEKTVVVKFDNTDNPNTIIAVNAIIDNILAATDNKLAFTYDRHAKYIQHKFNKPVDTKDTIKSTSKTLSYGDVVLYNGDTILIIIDNLSNVKFQYIKLGKINDTTMNLLYWFGALDTVDITFAQAIRPKVVSNITLKMNDEITNGVSMSENELREGITIKVEVDEPEAENTEITFVNPNLGIGIEKGEDNTYTITLSQNEQIPVFGSKEYTIKFGIAGKVTGTTIDLIELVYADFTIEAMSIANEHSEYSNDILTVDEDNIEIEDNVLTFAEGTAEYDEETGILTIE